MKDVRILFVGETWKGSSARSLREGLSSLRGVDLHELGEDHYFPRGRSLVLRASIRLLNRWHRAELETQIETRVDGLRPGVLIIYKGNNVSLRSVCEAKRKGLLTVNVFPDYSPHAYGKRFRAAMGEYDLVISTKPFHPGGWKAIYGYENPCVCVPHGYDPVVHYWADPPAAETFDVVLAATWRPQYEDLMTELAKILPYQLRVGIVGSGWMERAAKLPAQWELAPPLTGRAYGEWLRGSRIVIAPVNTDVNVGGIRQPGDEDTTRTYELAAAGCFFLHRRTPFAQTIYDEQTEVPMWDDANELAHLITKFLPLESERKAMAAKAHDRAVPAYSIPNRAAEVMAHVRAALAAAGKVPS